MHVQCLPTDKYKSVVISLVNIFDGLQDHWRCMILDICILQSTMIEDILMQHYCKISGP